MGRRGPAPKPTVLRVLKGDPPGRINSREPKPRAGLPEPPPWLSKAALPFWLATLRELGPMRVLTSADTDALARYAEHCVTFAEAIKAVRIGGVLIKGADGNLVKNPAVVIASHAEHHLSRLGREFGLTPAARVPLRTEERHRDPLDALLS